MGNIKLPLLSCNFVLTYVPSVHEIIELATLRDRDLSVAGCSCNHLIVYRSSFTVMNNLPGKHILFC